MYVTVHVPADRVQLVALNVPVLLLVKLTVPVGVTAPDPELSETVTVQVVGLLFATLVGEQETAVVVALFVDAPVNVPVLLE